MYKTDGTIATAYDYTPLRSGHGRGHRPTIQWSSEFYDAELGMVYYNIRHYNPRDGRWISRDPLEEEREENLYAMIDNGAFRTDHLGLFFDTIWDVGNMLWDTGVTIVGLVTNDSEMIEEGLTDLASDTAAELIPGLPAGGSKLARQMAKKAVKKKATKNAKRAAECEAIHEAYHALNCKKCSKCMKCSEVDKNIACWTALSSGRKLYLDKKCDYYLAGSLARGSKVSQAGHRRAYAEASVALLGCMAKLTTCK